MNVSRRILSLSSCLPALAMAATETDFAQHAFALRDSTLSGIAYREQIVVVPEPEDWKPAEKNRWKKFEEALGPGRSARRTVTGWRNNDGSRAECYSRCVINCCVESGGFSLLGAGFASK